MKYSAIFKGFIYTLLAFSYLATGSTSGFAASKKNLHKADKPGVYSVSVSSGQPQSSQASANLTISGDNSKVRIEKEGAVTLVAGNSILFHPGTKISCGGFLYASIEPTVKNGKHQKKEIRIVTVEEKQKIEEQESLSVAYLLFSPFPLRTKNHLHSGDTEDGSYIASGNETSAVTPEQQRKVTIETRSAVLITLGNVTSDYKPCRVALSSLRETTRVLRC